MSGYNKETHLPLRKFLLDYEDEDGKRVYFSDNAMDEIMNRALLEDRYEHNVGFRSERIDWEHSEREKAFHDQWLIENYPHAGLNHGQGILQDLFIDYNKDRNRSIILNNQERMIVATVIQWLGTNVGWCFLANALKRAGYCIVKIEK